MDIHQFKLARDDSAVDNMNHAIPVDWIDFISNGQVVLHKIGAEVQQH
jgi:hypothetical protein